MDVIKKINIGEYEKKPDGSWVCVKVADINTQSGLIIRVGPGFTFKKGIKYWGFDIPKVLDELSAN